MGTAFFAVALLLSAVLVAFPMARLYRSAPKTWLRMRKRPSSLKRPRHEQVLPAGARGALEIEPENCISCGNCVHNCPSKAISLTNLSGQHMLILNYSDCLLCGRCEIACPAEALRHTNGRAARMERVEYAVPNALDLKCRQCGREIEIPRLLSNHLYYHLTQERLRTLKLCAGCKRG